MSESPVYCGACGYGFASIREAVSDRHTLRAHRDKDKDAKGRYLPKSRRPKPMVFVRPYHVEVITAPISFTSGPFVAGQDK